MTMRCSTAALNALLMAIGASAALAQQPVANPQPSPTPSPSPTSSFEVYRMAEITTASAEAPAIDQATLITELTAEDIQSTNSRTVAEALAFVPGLRVASGRKNEANVSIHGFDQSRVLVLIDGVPYYETSYGKLDLNQIPTDNLARVDVVKGAASVLYGANALGGVINIITKKPTDKPATSVLAEAGENASYRLGLNHGMRVGRLNYWLSYTHQESDGWNLSDDFEPKTGKIVRKPGPTTEAVLEDGGKRNNSDLSRDDVWAKIGCEAGENGAYYANFHYLDMEKGAPPATDSVTVFPNRPAFSQFMRFPTYRDFGIDLDGQQKVGSAVGFKAKLFYHRHRDELESFSDADFAQSIALSRYQDYLAGGSLLAEYKAREWSTTRLALHYRADSHSERDDAYLPFADSRSATGSLGLETEFTRISNLSLVGGVGYDWFGVSEAERNVVSKTGDLVEQDPLATPKTHDLSAMAGANYSFNNGLRLFASAARKGRFPTLQQLYSSKGGNPDLDPELSNNYVAGVLYPIAKKATVGFTFFLNSVSDLISRNGPPPTSNYVNNDKTRMVGFELEAELQLVAGLTLRADYTFNDAKDRSANRVTDNLTYVARHKGGVGILAQLPKWETRVDVQGLYNDEFFSNLPTPQYRDDPTKKVDGSFALNAKLTQPFLKKFEGFLTVRNLLDTDYEWEPGYPAPGRVFSVGVGARF